MSDTHLFVCVCRDIIISLIAILNDRRHFFDLLSGAYTKNQPMVLRVFIYYHRYPHSTTNNYLQFSFSSVLPRSPLNKQKLLNFRTKNTKKKNLIWGGISIAIRPSLCGQCVTYCKNTNRVKIVPVVFKYINLKQTGIYFYMYR